MKKINLINFLYSLIAFAMLAFVFLLFGYLLYDAVYRGGNDHEDCCHLLSSIRSSLLNHRTCIYVRTTHDTFIIFTKRPLLLY